MAEARTTRVEVRKVMKTRWAFTAFNSVGGSFGMGTYPSRKAAVAAALRGVPNASEVEVVTLREEDEV